MTTKVPIGMMNLSITGTGNTFVMSVSPTLVTPLLGTPTSGVLTNCTGYVGTSSLTTVGALNSGSITSGFGAIDIGTDTLAAGNTTVTGYVSAQMSGQTVPVVLGQVSDETASGLIRFTAAATKSTMWGMLYSTISGALINAVPTGGIWDVRVAGGAVLRADSAGLAVTGFVSATGSFLIAGSGQGTASDRYIGADGSNTGIFYNVASTRTHTLGVNNVGVAAVSTAGLAVTGNLSTSGNLVAGSRNNFTSTDRISVAGATTIYSPVTGGSSVGASGSFIIINGYQTSTPANSFVDVVLMTGSGLGVVGIAIPGVNRGSPSGRTYTMSGTALQLAMASGTYNVACSAIEQAC